MAFRNNCYGYNLQIKQGLKQNQKYATIKFQ